MNTTTAILILAAHYIGDWVLQVFFQKWMGRKHRDWRHLATHVVVLTIPLMLLSPLWGIVNGLVHGAVDAVTSRLTHRFYSRVTMDLRDVDGRKYTAPIQSESLAFFWFTIGTDQFLHLALLFGTWGLLA